MFLKISQNSLENTCVRVSFFVIKKRLWHRCFPVNFAKFLKTPFITKHLWRLLLKTSIFSLFRSIHPEVFYINSAKFKGKHLRQRLFFNKAAGLSLQTLNKWRLCQRDFSMNFPKFLIEHFWQSTFEWIMLLPFISNKQKSNS